MHYCKLDGRIEITAATLVAISRMRAAREYLSDGELQAGGGADAVWRRQLTGQEHPALLSLEVTCCDVPCLISAEVDLLEDGVLTHIHKVTGDPTRPTREAVAQARGEAFCAAHMLACRGGGVCRLRILYVSDGFPLPHLAEEAPTEEQLGRFFDKLMEGLVLFAGAELERVSKRLPTLKALRFPFPEVREGQRELMETVYSTVKRGKRLFACAPTGIGKTVSVLYPALRSLGEGTVDKVFYLTPKNTAALAAADAVRLFSHGGALVKAVHLTAKDAICPAHQICREGERCHLSPIASTRLDAAARHLLDSGNPVIGKDEILRAALEYKVCPYELSLHYSMQCDVIICDYNYLFDPRVALKRYFSAAGRYAFLIDEAHNLVDRAREIYSTSLSLSQVDGWRRALKDLPAASAALTQFYQTLEGLCKAALKGEVQTDASGKKHAFASQKELPSGYYPALALLHCALADAQEKHPPQQLARVLRPIYYEVQGLLDKLSLYDERHIVFWQYEEGDLSLSTLCLDPSAIVGARLSLGRAAVLFSATLSPLDYYREVLGGDKTSPTLSLASPFDEHHLAVAVMDKISTRYLEREDTVRAVLRAILTTVKAKPGNYMVFCPSYHYMRLLHAALKKALPALKTLLQTPHMTAAERAEFLSHFDEHPKEALVGFCVMGGIYGEGVDLVGKRLIGAIVVGVGLPTLSNEREAIRAYFDETQEAGRAYAYVYPGFNRVLQAAGRVIRHESDRGVILLIDDRFADPEYRRLFPAHWRGLRYVGDGESLAHLLRSFWQQGRQGE